MLDGISDNKARVGAGAVVLDAVALHDRGFGIEIERPMRLLEAQHGLRARIVRVERAGISQKQMAGFMCNQLQRVVAALGSYGKDVARIQRKLAERTHIEHGLQPRGRAKLATNVEYGVSVTGSGVPDGLLPGHRVRSRSDVFVIEEGDVIVSVVVRLKELLRGGF